MKKNKVKIREFSKLERNNNEQENPKGKNRSLERSERWFYRKYSI